MKKRRIPTLQDSSPNLRPASIKFGFKTLCLLLFSHFIQHSFMQVQAQNLTQVFPNLNWDNGHQIFEMGNTTGLTGLELNFWMKPILEPEAVPPVPPTAADDKSFAVLRFLNAIDFIYEYFKTAVPKSQNFVMRYGAKNYSYSMPMSSPPQWLNVNLRTQFGQYIILAVWQGIANLETAPDFSLNHPNPAAFVNYTLDFSSMDPSFYVQLAEIRIIDLDTSKSWNQFLKYYHGIWPKPSTFELQRQYYTSFNNILYLDINNKLKYMNTAGQENFPVSRCLYGQSISSSQQCSNCTIDKDCLLCPSNYNKVCKLCSNANKTTTCREDTTACPIDYYLFNGICLRCPPGCSSCTNPRTCQTCDAGLNSATNLTHSVCKCNDGQYGVPNFLTDKLICSNCDYTACEWCENQGTTCTKCSTASNKYLYDSKCVLDCKNAVAVPIPSFTSVADRKCYPCGTNCLDCTNATYCNFKKCKWESLDPNGVLSYNHNGICKTLCPDSSLANILNKTCDDCGKNCAACVGLTENCTICQIGYVLDNAKCISKCPPGKYPDTSNVCQYCPSQCILCEAASQCTKCKNLGPTFPLDSYYFVNYQCVLECPDRYYKDGSDPWDLFCRSCPSGCNQCTDENTCTVCDLGWYLDSFYADTRKLCVNKCQPGFFPNNATMACNTCLTGCNKCDNVTTCYKCSQGLVLEKNGATTTCSDSCSSGMYPDSNNICQNCISGCKRCSNNHTCAECNLGYYLVEGILSCVQTSCPEGYYISGGNCLKCRPQCKSCSAPLTCNTCIVGYEYKTGQCNLKCGNRIREDNEECDDGNPDSDDGCSSMCQVEDGFECMPLDTTTTGPDVCFCDAKLQSAGWTAFWGQIEIIFSSNIVFNTANGAKSADAKLFCSQILNPSLLINLGTDYSCFLDASITGSSLRINVDLDSPLGNNAMNFTTQVVLVFDALQIKDCPTSIPLIYSLTNLPLDSPNVYFQTSHNGLIVPKCSSYWGLNIFTSKGFTKRNVAVQWILLSMQPDDSDLKNELQEYLDLNYIDVKYFEFLADQIERLAGKSINMKVIVTNFLGIIGSNITTVQFSNMKSMLLVDLQDIYTFETAVDNTLAPRIRIPYCTGEASYNQETELKQVSLQCTLYSSDLPRKTPLTNCTIRAFNMTLGSSYKVKVQAVNLKDPNMGVTKWVHIDTASPNARIAYIQGCNRLFSVNNSFDLEAMIATNVSYAKFNWYCTDTSTGSPCFTTSFSYITMANTKRVTIPGGQLFSNNTYLFKVIVFDQLSQTETIKECNMYAAPIEDTVLDIMINTEANRNGFIDFNAQMAAFKVQTINAQNVNRNLLSFKWKFTDSSGTVFKASDLSIYQNSLGVLISKLERSNIYKVETNATYGTQKGYIRTFYDTEPQMSFEFSVEPPVGEPHKTIFTFSVTSQDTLDGLYYYVFGYVNPVDKISNIPIYQKSTNRYQRTQLPVPQGQSYLTCYVQVMLPSGESKTYQQNVTMTSSTISVEDFKSQLSNAVMDDLVESMQIKNKLVTLGGRMGLSDRSYAIRQILKGLQGENTPLSDYYIQSSVASLLEYISNEVESLMADKQIVTVAANIFQQITIDENKDIANGRYSQFGRAATFSLYNFANNIFQKDFSSVIGGGNNIMAQSSFLFS